MTHPTHLPRKVVKAVKEGTHHVPSGPKTWNVYVDQPRSKGSFVFGLLVGAAGVAYLVVSKSQSAREDLTDRVGTLKSTARDRAVEVADRAKPRVQEIIDKAAGAVTGATESVRDKTEDLASTAQDKVGDPAEKSKPRTTPVRPGPPPTTSI